jgi:hypothetical protein
MKRQKNKKALDRAFLIKYLGHELRRNDSIAQWLLVMSDEIKKLSPEEKRALLIDATRREADALAQLRSLLTEELRAARDPQSQPNRSDGKQTKANLGDLSKLPLIEATVAYLRTCKRPQGVRRIWAALESAGCKVESGEPVKSVTWALRKMPMHPDVIYIGFNQWHVRSRYKGQSDEKIRAKWTGKGGRTTREHAKRTREGMKKSGKRLGRPPMFKPEIIEKAKEMIRAGIPVSEVCKNLGVSKHTLSNRGIKIRQLQQEARNAKAAEPTEADNVVRFAKS